ncbi:unnamed protein product, partial [marine sediment metagenome]
MNISIVITAKDEESNLARLLTSLVPFWKELHEVIVT